jgi:XTP/dITP diphosphohydrolase
MTFLIATNNTHKKHELQQIMKEIEFTAPDESGISFDCEETGSTFLENSLLKAQTLHDLTGKPVLADDSGLCVEGLGGAPGIFSARYGSTEKGKELESLERNRYLLSSMEHLRENKDRRAFFVCCMTAILGEYRTYIVQETIEGYITHSPSGAGGFGYDPVFFIPEKKRTMAELSEKEKNLISHRGRAASRLAEMLKGEN